MPNAQISKAWLQRIALFHLLGRTIGDRVAPPWRVPAEEFEYKEWGAEHLREVDTVWQAGAKPSESQFGWATRSARTVPHKHRVPLTNRDLAKAQAPGGIGEMALRRRRVAVATGVIITGYEAEVVSAFTDSNNYPAGHVVTKGPGTEWDNGADDQAIIDDIKTGINTICDTIVGVAPSDLTVVVPDRVFRTALQYNEVILGAVKSGIADQVTNERFTTYFGVRQLLRPTAAKLSGALNVDDRHEDYQLVTHWGDNVWIGLVGDPEAEGVQADDAGLFEEQILGFAATAYWTGDTQGQRRLVREYEDPDPGTETTWYEVKEERKVVIADKRAGYLIKNTLSAI
jgi:hypothetical protein